MRLAAAALLLSVQAAASGDPLLGPRVPEPAVRGFSARPYVKLGESYRSNIFRSPDPVSSWIHAVNAGLSAVWQAPPRHRLALGYDLEYEALSHDPSANNALNQAALGDYAYTGPLFGARLRDAFLSTVDPPNSEQTGRRRRWQNEAALGLEYAPEEGKGYASAEGSHTTHKYVADDPVLRSQLNRYEQLAGFRLGYSIQPKTRAYAAYRPGRIHYTAAAAGPTKNHQSHSVLGGLEADLAAKLQGRFEAGVTRRRYDDPLPDGSRDASEFVFSGSLAYLPLERTALDLRASRTLQEATFAANRYYVATAGSARLRHRLPRHWTLGLEAGAEHDAFPEPAAGGERRSDRIYDARVSADYAAREWLRLGASYEYRARFSPGFSGQFGYRDHVVGVTAGLSLGPADAAIKP